MAVVEVSQREALADRICDWVLEHGVGRLSLRPLAQDLEISTYPLIYWFGSKEGVIAAALTRSEQRQMLLLQEWAGEDGEIALGRLFRRYWKWGVSPRGRPYLRLFAELNGLAQRDRSLGAYVDRALSPWRTVIQAYLEGSGVAPDESAARTTLLIATAAGLQIDLATTGDVKRTTAAAAVFAEELEALGNAAAAR
jgi:AcrR family transcriptional regulator